MSTSQVSRRTTTGSRCSIVRRRDESRTFRFVVHHRVLDYARLGWIIEATMEDCHQGEYSILMEWLCDCSVVEPPLARRGSFCDPSGCACAHAGLTPLAEDV